MWGYGQCVCVCMYVHTDSMYTQIYIHTYTHTSYTQESPREHTPTPPTKTPSYPPTHSPTISQFVSRPTTPLLKTKLSTFKTSLHPPPQSSINSLNAYRKDPKPSNMYSRDDGTEWEGWCQSDDVVVGARDEKEKGERWRRGEGSGKGTGNGP